jgi:hypothetical protein
VTRWIAASLVALSLGLILNLQADPADGPVKERGLVYRLELFNGRAHVYAHSPAKAQTIYALAGTALVLNPRMTLVYYWPITRRVMADWDGLDEPVTGALEVLQAGRVILSTTVRWRNTPGRGAGESDCPSRKPRHP